MRPLISPDRLPCALLMITWTIIACSAANIGSDTKGCPHASAATGLLQSSRSLLPGETGMSPVDQPHADKNMTEKSAPEITTRPGCVVHTKDVHRNAADFAKAAKDGTKCLFGVDIRDEGEHCIFDNGIYGTYGWCYTDTSLKTWGSCTSTCPLGGIERMLNEKIDAIDAKLEKRFDSIDKKLSGLGANEVQESSVDEKQDRAEEKSLDSSDRISEGEENSAGNGDGTFATSSKEVEEKHKKGHDNGDSGSRMTKKRKSVEVDEETESNRNEASASGTNIKGKKESVETASKASDNDLPNKTLGKSVSVDDEDQIEENLSHGTSNDEDDQDQAESTSKKKDEPKETSNRSEDDSGSEHKNDDDDIRAVRDEIQAVKDALRAEKEHGEGQNGHHKKDAKHEAKESNSSPIKANESSSDDREDEHADT